MSVSVHTPSQNGDALLMNWPNCLTDMEILSVKDMDLLMDATKSQSQSSQQDLTGSNMGDTTVIDLEEAMLLDTIKTEQNQNPSQGGLFTPGYPAGGGGFPRGMPPTTDGPREFHGNGPGGMQQQQQQPRFSIDQTRSYTQLQQQQKLPQMSDSSYIDINRSTPSSSSSTLQLQSAKTNRDTNFNTQAYLAAKSKDYLPSTDSYLADQSAAASLYQTAQTISQSVLSEAQFSVSDPSQLRPASGGHDPTLRGHDTTLRGHDPDLVILGEDHLNKKCLVCGDEATGMYFGALVCVPCKTFFLRYAGDNFSFVCKHNKCCDITISTRTQCKYCRYQKCLRVGMCRKERPAKVELSEGQQLCVVCQDIANGVHFGAITCEGCKKFFRRGLTENGSYVCKLSQTCEINPRTRNSCRFCRYQKCLRAGMSREAIQMGRPSKFKPVHITSSSGTPNTSFDSGTTLSPGSGHPHPGQLMSPGRRADLSRALSVQTDGQPPLKQVKLEPLSPVSSSDMYGHQQPAGMVSPGLASTSGRSAESLLTSLYPAASTTPTSSGMLSPGLTLEQQQLLDALSPRATETLLRAMSQRLDLPPPAPPPPPPQRELSTKEAAQLTSSHAMSGGTATFFQTPSYLQGNKRYITNETIYNAFVDGALDNKVKLKERRHKSRSNASTTSSSTRPDPVPTVMPTMPPTESYLGENAMKRVFPSQPSTPGLPSPASPSVDILPSPGGRLDILPSPGGRLDILPPGMMPDLDSLARGADTGAETVDYILLNQLMTPPGMDTSRLEMPVLSSPPDSLPPQDPPLPASSLVDLASPVDTYLGGRVEDEGGGGLLDPPLGPPKAEALSPSATVTMATKGPLESPQAGSSGDKSRCASPPGGACRLADVSNKSPGSSSSTSCSSGSSQFGDNGSVYDYIIELSKQVDLVKRKEDSDSESTDKDNSARDLLSHDTPNLNFKNFKEYWLETTTMPDESISLTEEHNQNIIQIEKVYRNFVDTGTKINRRLKHQLEKWMELHQGQYTAPPAWINEKVVPIYTLMSVTYCRNLPGFVDFHKHDQSTIIKLGQSQSRILVASKHWFDPTTGDFRDFMSWRGARKGTSDGFKKKLIRYAQDVQDKNIDDIEAAFLNVLVLIATDYPEIRNAKLIEKHRQSIMDSFRAYTTAKYGSQNTRMELLFTLIPELRVLGLEHHRMTFHMRSARTASTSST